MLSLRVPPQACGVFEQRRLVEADAITTASSRRFDIDDKSFFAVIENHETQSSMAAAQRRLSRVCHMRRASAASFRRGLGRMLQWSWFRAESLARNDGGSGSVVVGK